MTLPRLRIGRFGVMPDSSSTSGPKLSKDKDPLAGSLDPTKTPIPPPRLFGIRHMVLYRTSYFGESEYSADFYDMLIQWVPEKKVYYSIEVSGGVAMTAPGTADDAGVPLLRFIGGVALGRYLRALGQEFKPGGGDQGTQAELDAYDHTAAEAAKAADEAATAAAMAEAEAAAADAADAEEAQAEADEAAVVAAAAQDEADKLAFSEDLTTWTIRGIVAVPLLWLAARFFKRK